MPAAPHRLALVALACAALTSGAWSATTDEDALDLQTSDPAPSTETPTPLKLSAEVALGRGQLRGAGHQSLRRASLDLLYTAQFGRQWRVALSNRLDVLHPTEGEDNAINSLREAYVGWQDVSAQWVIEAGRINLRQGPGLGFNPTDFFRDSALRVSTTVNPFLVREYRMGTVMLRAQRLSGDSAVSLAWSPKLANTASTSGFSADLGATNNRDRGLLSVSNSWNTQFSSLLHVFVEQGGKPRLGASATALLNDATVAHVELAWGQEPALVDRAMGNPGQRRAGQAAAGFTYTTKSKLSLSVEYEYNGQALREPEWNQLAALQPAALGGYLWQADRRQDLAARQAVLLYAKQSDALQRGLDLTGMLRTNLGDNSAMVWLEARYRLGSTDLALQWLRYRGGAVTEYGLNPYSSSWQLVANHYF